MRLNRVLLLAATINILIFALVFTISCSSGDNGPQGRDADHCVVNDDWDIICSYADGKVVKEGHLNGGEGAPGAQGDRGDQGNGCKLGEKVDNGYQILCGPAGSEEVKGTLDGCALSFKGNYEVNINCGNTSLGLCGGRAFNPETHYCSVAGTTATVEEFSEDDYEDCGTTNPEVYNIKIEYCGWAADDAKNGITEATHVYKRCPATDGSEQPNADAWNKEYCRYTSEKEITVSKEYCDDGGPINKDSWQEQYCGYPDRGAVKKKVLKGVCDNPGTAIVLYASQGTAAAGQKKDGSNFITIPNVYGPNEITFGQGYCEVRFENRATGKTTYSERICGASGRPNEKKWLKQYCGYDKETDKIPTKVFSDMCSDGSRPYARGDFVQTASSDGVTIYYSIASNRAYKFDSDNLNVPGGLSLDNSAPAYNGPQSSSYSGRRYFCGYLNAKGETQLPGVFGTTLLPACPTAKADRNSNVKYTYKTYNTSKWNGDYCGYKVGTKALPGFGIASDGRNEFGGLGGQSWDTDRFVSDMPSGKSVPSFLKQALEKSISSTPDTLYLGSSKQSACDDGRGPFMYKFASATNNGRTEGQAGNGGQAWNGYCKTSGGGTVLVTASMGNDGFFCDGQIIPKNAYCGKGYDSKKSGSDKRITKLYTSGVCGDGVSGPFKDLFGGANATKATAGFFCGMKTVSDRLTTALPKCGDGKNYNESSWKGEYCGYTVSGLTDPANPVKNGSPATVANQKVYKGLCTYDWRGNYDYLSASAGYGNVSLPTFGDKGFCQGIASQGAYNQGVTTGLTQLVSTAYQIIGQYNPITQFPATCPTSATPKKLNEGSWKGEYCVGSATKVDPATKTGYKVLTCQGILIPERTWDVDTKCNLPEYHVDLQ